MLTVLDKNFATVAMLAAFMMAVAAVVFLLASGKVQGSDPVAVGLLSAVTGLAGGIGGYSMHRQSDSSVQTPGVQITKTESGG